MHQHNQVDIAWLTPDSPVMSCDKEYAFSTAFLILRLTLQVVSKMGVKWEQRSAASCGQRSRPAEWCNWPRVSLRGGGCRFDYGAMVAGMAIALAGSAAGSPGGGLGSLAMEASDR